MFWKLKKKKVSSNLLNNCIEAIQVFWKQNPLAPRCILFHMDVLYSKRKQPKQIHCNRSVDKLHVYFRLMIEEMEREYLPFRLHRFWQTKWECVLTEAYSLPANTEPPVSTLSLWCTNIVPSLSTSSLIISICFAVTVLKTAVLSNSLGQRISAGKLKWNE